jgi:hypothetical protein
MLNTAVMDCLVDSIFTVEKQGYIKSEMVEKARPHSLIYLDWSGATRVKYLLPLHAEGVPQGETSHWQILSGRGSVGGASRT